MQRDQIVFIGGRRHGDAQPARRDSPSGNDRKFDVFVSADIACEPDGCTGNRREALMGARFARLVLWAGVLLTATCSDPILGQSASKANNARTVTPSRRIERLVDAIEHVETGGEQDPANARGDGGRSLGPYQIMRAYWIDSRMPGQYKQVRDRAYARQVVLRYWKRYAPRALKRAGMRDLEVMARMHNGGPAGHRKAATIGYWKKVRARLQQLERLERAERDRSTSTRPS
jgi:hypothetical protein